jgi:hypothetical protein
MKKLTIMILIISFVPVLYSRPDPQITGELKIHIVDNPVNFDVTIILDLVNNTLCWDAHPSPDIDLHNLTTFYQGSEQTTNQDVNWSAVWAYPGREHCFALGLYRISAEINGNEQKHFYLDYRTSTLPENFQADLELDYSVTDKKFYRRSTTNEVPTNATIWGLQSGTGYNDEELQPLPPSNYDLTQQSGSPYLSWNSSSSSLDNCTGYAVYRSVVNYGYPPGTFSKVKTLSSTVTSWIDWSFTIGSMKTAYYKMVALNGQAESEFTSTQSINVVPAKSGVGNNKQYEFSLKQNYPNPFNPSTRITYSIPREVHVTLKVYDLLGNEVMTLVDEIQNEGEYNAYFKGIDLTSGLYIYVLKAGNLETSKKLLLVK